MSFLVALTTSEANIPVVYTGNLKSEITLLISLYSFSAIFPFFKEIYVAAAIPMATHSPCKRLKFFAFSTAWPIV